jgi:hypothetical protein
MGLRTLLRWVPAGGVFLHLSSISAFALLKLNEGRDQIFVTGSVAVGYDSNIFSTAGAEGDVFTNSSLLLEYARRAGMIAVNGEVGWNLGSFASNPSEDFSNPTLGLEFIKNSGRTTGSFTLGASRQSQADPNVNLRTESWNYNAGLNWKYPVIERYSLAGSFGYGRIDYVENSSGLIDLATYSASTDLFYTYTSQRDLLGGYRIRLSDTSSGGQTSDHAFTAGVSGKILAKLKGNVRGGYQIRHDSTTGETFGSVTSSASVTWAFNKRLTLTGSVNKDFSTTATESSVDTLSCNLDAQYAIRNRWSLYSGLGGGHSEFLNGMDRGREDYYFTWSAGVNYSMNDHFKASLTYSYFQNWSNRSASSFDRHSITLNVSSRW